MPALVPTLLADDHAPMRGLFRLVLEDDGFEIVAEAATGAEAVEQALLHRPVLCVLDMDMPEGGGIHAVAEIARQLPETVCVIVTASQRPEDLVASLRLGADGFLPKDMDLERLPAALRGALRGETAVPRARMALVVDELRRMPVAEPGRRVVDLTDDEWQVVQDLRVRRGDRTASRRWPRRP